MFWLLLVALTAAPPDLTLRGTIVTDRAEARVALVQSAGRSRIVAVGESAFGGRITAIRRDSVTVAFGDQPVTIRLAAPPLVTVTERPPVLRPDEPPEDPATPAQTMTRASVDQRLAIEMNRILSDTALVPVMEDGRVTGLAVTRIAAGSLLTDVGLRAGDVLKELNGTQIDGLATLMGLYSRLQGEKELRAVVQRDGHPVSLRVTLQ